MHSKNSQTLRQDRDVQRYPKRLEADSQREIKLGKRAKDPSPYPETPS